MEKRVVMIGFLLLYFVWKRFADLALQYGKSKHNGWFGILVYIGGLLSFGIVLGILNGIFNWEIDWENNMVIKLMDIPLGILCCYILYVILKKKWESEVVKLDTIDDIGKPIQTEDNNR
jgi:NADH:ubiquinone oxidoreductase subunit 5 (subunit L)/multisubunit Na+/H+ antiporter MnhA subunit